MKRNTEFEDAQALQRQYPATFSAPTAEELQQLKPGDYVKVCANKERFWAEVITVDGEAITARVDNHLILNPERLNDTISFNINNVYTILPPRPLNRIPDKLKPAPAKKPRKKGKGL